MKLSTILFEKEYQSDNARSRKWMDQEELQKLFDLVEPGMMDKDEVSSASYDLAGSSEFLRTPGAAKLSLARMHVLIHGQIPDGMDVDNTWLNKISGNIVNFVRNQGYDVERHLQSARANMEERMAQKSRQISKEEALKVMSGFYRENRHNLQPCVTQHRDTIIQNLMNGNSPEEAFAEFVK